MHDIELYTKVLGVKPPWMVRGVQLNLKQRTVTISVSHDNSEPVACPICQGQASIYDHLKRRWRLLRGSWGEAAAGGLGGSQRAVHRET